MTSLLLLLVAGVLLLVMVCLWFDEVVSEIKRQGLFIPVVMGPESRVLGESRCERPVKVLLRGLMRMGS